MPCLLGRSRHVLLKKDCLSGCACCVNTPYSVGKLCCDEPRDNSTNRGIQNLACQLIKEAVEELGCDSGLTHINTLKFPREHCKVRLEMRNLTQEDATIFDIENAQITVIELSNPVNDDLLAYYVDGVECLRCTFVDQ